METLSLIFLAVIGLCAGSLAYAMTLRMYDGRDWVKGRSECDMCHKPLRWYDLLPVVSWLSTAGKCRYCKKRLGTGYPLIELGVGASFVLSYIYWPYGFTRIGIAIFGAWLVMLTLMASLIIFDLKWYLLPDRIVYTLIGLAGASKLVQILYFQDLSKLVGIIGGVLVGWGVFYFLYVLSKGKYIGGGDVKYGLFFGVLLASPFKSLLVISVGSLLGTLFVLPSVINRRTKMTSEVPFGPSLVLATVILYLFGDRIVDILTTAYLFP
jgi:prepilin signal peptidase PulO-like enzyme (type II secretory pathway)